MTNYGATDSPNLHTALFTRGMTRLSTSELPVLLATLCRKPDKLIFVEPARQAHCGAILLMRSRVLLLDRAGNSAGDVLENPAPPTPDDTISGHSLGILPMENGAEGPNPGSL